MLVQAARRLALIFGAILGSTVVVSVLLGLVAGASLGRSVAIGLYVAGAVALLGCFVMGARGPLRGQGASGENAPLIGARKVRRATSDERTESTRTALLLFGLGLVLVVIGSVIDPAHKAF
ncbi:MAG: hypothetical protein ACTHKS_15725 [Gaiellaceae bacterium]